MAPFDSGLPTKISPLIDGQVPDFIQADHPVFVEFLEQYYKFLESAEITIDGTVDDLLLETFTTSYVALDGTNESGLDGGDRVVLEKGSGTTGKFEIGETITSPSGDTLMRAEVAKYSDSDDKIHLIHAGADDGKYHAFTVGKKVVGLKTGAGGIINLVVEDNQLSQNEQNTDFTTATDFIDFSETNPFGDTSNN